MAARFLSALGWLLLAGACASSPEPVAPRDALSHVGELARVCGVVASAAFKPDVNGKPTFLNLDEPFPNHVFTAVIWGEARPNFSYKPESLEGTRICVIGEIRKYQGKPEVVVSGPSQVIRSLKP